MQIYIVIIEDRHTDPTAHPFTDPNVAIESCVLSDATRSPVDVDDISDCGCPLGTLPDPWGVPGNSRSILTSGIALPRPNNPRLSIFRPCCDGRRPSKGTIRMSFVVVKLKLVIDGHEPRRFILVFVYPRIASFKRNNSILRYLFAPLCG